MDRLWPIQLHLITSSLQMGNAGYWLKSSKFFDSTSLDNKQSSNG
ncbi:hypothetical protein WN943_001827 [Citrus x changshan-huyou]